MLHVTHKLSTFHQAEMKHLLCNKPASAREWFSGSGWAEREVPRLTPDSCVGLHLFVHQSPNVSKTSPSPCSFLSSCLWGPLHSEMPTPPGEVRRETRAAEGKTRAAEDGVECMQLWCAEGPRSPRGSRQKRKFQKWPIFSLIPPWNVKKLFERGRTNLTFPMRAI